MTAVCQQDTAIERLFDEIEGLDSDSRQGYGSKKIKNLAPNSQKMAVLDNISDIVVQFNSQAEILWLNKAGCDFLGKPRDYVIQNNYCNLFCIGKKQNCINALVAKTLETNQPQQEKMYFSDGSTRFVCCYPTEDWENNNKEVWSIAVKIEYKETTEDLTAFQKRLSLLSRREKQVMRLVADGKANKVIAAELDISPKTVEIHRSRAMNKLDVDSVAMLVRYISESEKVLKPFDSNYFCI